MPKQRQIPRLFSQRLADGGTEQDVRAGRARRVDRIRDERTDHAAPDARAADGAHLQLVPADLVEQPRPLAFQLVTADGRGQRVARVAHVAADEILIPFSHGQVGRLRVPPQRVARARHADGGDQVMRPAAQGIQVLPRRARVRRLGVQAALAG